MDASPATPSSEAPSNPPPPPDVPASPPPEAPRRRVSWLGLATAGVGLVLAVLGLGSLLMSRDNGVSALEARPAGPEFGVAEPAPPPPPPAAGPERPHRGAGR